MAKKRFDPDQVGRNSVGYWAAVLAFAVQSGDSSRACVARAELRRLKCDITRQPHRTAEPDAGDRP